MLARGAAAAAPLKPARAAPLPSSSKLKVPSSLSPPAVQGPKLQLAVVRHLVYEGIPESPGLRVLVWKARRPAPAAPLTRPCPARLAPAQSRCRRLSRPSFPHTNYFISPVLTAIAQVLLGLLPPERDAWEATLARSRAEYARFVEELITEPQREMKKAADDHPLALEQSSVWNKYFKDGELRDQIARDVERTRRELHFFNAEVRAARRRAQCRASAYHAERDGSFLTCRIRGARRRTARLRCTGRRCSGCSSSSPRQTRGCSTCRCALAQRDSALSPPHRAPCAPQIGRAHV